MPARRCVWVSRRWRLSGADAWAIACYGIALGATNLVFYLALRSIPFGVAVAIEFSGLCSGHLG